MKNDFIKICFLYSDSMNIYGDRGNVICLSQRARWRGKEVLVENYNIGDEYDFSEVDLFFFGGGQDQQQEAVAADLVKTGNIIKEQVIEKKAALLSICGGMQLMAKYYQTKEGKKIMGAGLFDAYTEGGDERFIGNIVVESDLFGPDKRLVGFENHSGRTYIKGDLMKPLGRVIYGRGNNGKDGYEGIRYLNAVGSYMHGCILSKNPWLADWLLLAAFKRRYHDYHLNDLEDVEEMQANKLVMELARVNTKVYNISSKN